MKVKVDAEKCSGDAVCSEMCPEVFEMNDEDIATVIVDVVPPELEDEVREAAEACPEECITIEE
ncbi:MAG: ferredoxin [candidate division Zixibacteria bacterium]|nr:ferredoxin [candidate division Zixibacteria bacterium]